MEISTSSYYNYKNRKENPSEDLLEQAVQTAFWRHKRRYGSRRLVAELRDEGFIVGRTRTRSIMQKYTLYAIQPKSFVPKTTKSHPHLRRSANLLIDRVKVSKCNEVWVGDITYIPLADGNWAYLAIWLDLFSRYLVGWDIQLHMEDSLVIAALDKAVQKRRPPKGLLVHSDGGGQYASVKFRNRLGNQGYEQSMTRKDNHYDNAHSESLFSRFKAEVLEDGIFSDLEEARIECFEFIELYYNPIRRHSSLDNKSPLQFEKEWQA